MSTCSIIIIEEDIAWWLHSIIVDNNIGCWERDDGDDGDDDSDDEWYATDFGSILSTRIFQILCIPMNNLLKSLFNTSIIWNTNRTFKNKIISILSLKFCTFCNLNTVKVFHRNIFEILFVFYILDLK